jgi:hypothetical protein
MYVHEVSVRCSSRVRRKVNVALGLKTVENTWSLVQPRSTRRPEPNFIWSAATKHQSITHSVAHLHRICSCCWCRWGETTSLNCDLQQACVHSPDYRWVWSPCGVILRKESRRSRWKTCPCASVHRSHMDWPGRESEPPWWEASN